MMTYNADKGGEGGLKTLKQSLLTAPNHYKRVSMNLVADRSRDRLGSIWGLATSHQLLTVRNHHKVNFAKKMYWPTAKGGKYEILGKI